jgi:hypothetical protein
MPLRKRFHAQSPSSDQTRWLRLEELAEVSVSSEDASHPVEGALIDGAGAGWRAAAPGEQSLGIHFDEPRTVTRIHLIFEEVEHERVQEFAIRWSADRCRTFQLVVRQQFSFSPSAATREIEDYHVALDAATDVELHIIPDISHRPRTATLTRLRLQ